TGFTFDESIILADMGFRAPHRAAGAFKGIRSGNLLNDISNLHLSLRVIPKDFLTEETDLRKSRDEHDPLINVFQQFVAFAVEYQDDLTQEQLDIIFKEGYSTPPGKIGRASCRERV